MLTQAVVRDRRSAARSGVGRGATPWTGTGLALALTIVLGWPSVAALAQEPAAEPAAPAPAAEPAAPPAGETAPPAGEPAAPAVPADPAVPAEPAVPGELVPAGEPPAAAAPAPDAEPAVAAEPSLPVVPAEPAVPAETPGEAVAAPGEGAPALPPAIEVPGPTSPAAAEAAAAPSSPAPPAREAPSAVGAAPAAAAAAQRATPGAAPGAPQPETAPQGEAPAGIRTVEVPPSGTPEAGAGAQGDGLLQRMARSLFPGKSSTPDAAGVAAGDEELASEGREVQRKTKELVGLALRNIEKKRISEAKKNLNDLITLRPYEAEYHLALGLCFRQEKRYKDAQKKYQDVLDLGGPRSLVNLLMAEVAAESGDKDKVFEHLREAAVGGRNIIHDVQNLSLLEKYKSDTEFIKLALALEKFEVLSKKGQDPFTNPFPSSSPAGLPKLPTGPASSTNLTPQEQQNMLADARRTLEKVQWYIKLEDEQKAMESYIRLREIVEKRDLLTLPKIQNDFRILMARMENLETQIEGIRLRYYYNQAQARLKEMGEAFQATEFARVDVLHAEMEKLAKEMEKANARFKPVADAVLNRARVWLNRANIRREFQTQKPEIQGVVIASDVKLAIIENRIYKQGEVFGDFQIQKVENNRVTFRYKGEEIPLIFRRY